MQPSNANWTFKHFHTTILLYFFESQVLTTETQYIKKCLKTLLFQSTKLWQLVQFVLGNLDATSFTQARHNPPFFALYKVSSIPRSNWRASSKFLIDHFGESAMHKHQIPCHSLCCICFACTTKKFSSLRNYPIFLKPKSQAMALYSQLCPNLQHFNQHFWTNP